jgi:twitching motility protein PilT
MPIRKGLGEMPNGSLAENILMAAGAAGASDLHLMAGAVPMMRINGRLTAMNFSALRPSDTMEMVLNLMSAPQRESFEVQGEIDLAYSIPDGGRYRVHAYRQMGTVALAFRIVGDRIPTAEEIGIPEQVLKLSTKSRGLILVTGAAGSGKSTTLAVLVDAINRSREAHVITLEDPVEYVHPHQLSVISQREIGVDSQSYEAALHAALREDPDVIMIGELMDSGAIRGALAAAEAGHLVLGAMHTLSAQGTIDRIVDAYPADRQRQAKALLSNVLVAMVSQKLISSDDGSSCRAAFEVLEVNDQIRKVIRREG